MIPYALVCNPQVELISFIIKDFFSLGTIINDNLLFLLYGKSLKLYDGLVAFSMPPDDEVSVYSCPCRGINELIDESFEDCQRNSI